MIGQLCSSISTTFFRACPNSAMYPPSSRIFTSSPTRSFRPESGIRLRFASRTSCARCFRSRTTASRPSRSSMKFRAHKVMWVYASGKRVADFLLRLKNTRGRPRPPALNERSTRPFASSEFKCFSVAILEIRSSADMSVSETVPRRLSVTRICFLADEQPEYRPPEPTSFTFMSPQAKAFPYHIPNRLQSRESERHRSDSPPEEGKEERGGGSRPLAFSCPEAAEEAS